MKNLKLLIIILFVLGVLPLAASLARADVENHEFLQKLSTNLVMGTGLIKTHQFEMGTEISHITYREPGEGVKEKGMTYGIFGVYNYRPAIEHIAAWLVDVYHIDFHLNYSLMNYSGSGTVNDINDYMIEPRIWFGKDLVLNSTSRVTPYVGVGYRYLLDQLGGNVSTIGANGYDRRSQYLYIPVGAEMAFIPTEGWEVRLNGEYDFFVHGWHMSYLSQVPTEVLGTSYPNLKNDQSKGYGLRGSMDLIKKGNGFNIIFSPYVRYWNIKQSKIQTAANDFGEVVGMEPANNSTEIGARLGVQL